MVLRALSLLAALAACAVSCGCGPSLRRVHQGDVYFERCYAADLDVAVPAAERRACWAAWHEHYELGASAERVDHATERLAMLDPARGAAIALATGDDPVLPATDLGEQALVQMVSPDAPPVEPAPPIADPSEPGSPRPVAPTPLVEDVTTHVQIVEAEERQRAAERRAHRSILAPRTTTPECARSCQPRWERCVADCTADERGCTSACRRELTICSRGCY